MSGELHDTFSHQADMTFKSSQPGCYTIVRDDLLFTMSDNTHKQPAPEGTRSNVRIHFLTDEH
jgi:hypothetical protein